MADEEVVEEEKVPEKKVDKVKKVVKVPEPEPVNLSEYLIKPIRKKTNKIYVKEQFDGEKVTPPSSPKKKKIVEEVKKPEPIK